MIQCKCLVDTSCALLFREQRQEKWPCMFVTDTFFFNLSFVGGWLGLHCVAPEGLKLVVIFLSLSPEWRYYYWAWLNTFFCFVLFWHKVSGLGCPGIHYTAEGDLNFSPFCFYFLVAKQAYTTCPSNIICLQNVDYICVLGYVGYVCVCVWMQVPAEMRKGYRSQWSRVSGGFELPGVDARNWIRVLFKKYT